MCVSSTTSKFATFWRERTKILPCGWDYLAITFHTRIKQCFVSSSSVYLLVCKISTTFFYNDTTMLRFTKTISLFSIGPIPMQMILVAVFSAVILVLVIIIVLIVFRKRCCDGLKGSKGSPHGKQII